MTEKVKKLTIPQWKALLKLTRANIEFQFDVLEGKKKPTLKEIIGLVASFAVVKTLLEIENNNIKKAKK